MPKSTKLKGTADSAVKIPRGGAVWRIWDQIGWLGVGCPSAHHRHTRFPPGSSGQIGASQNLIDNCTNKLTLYVSSSAFKICILLNSSVHTIHFDQLHTTATEQHTATSPDTETQYTTPHCKIKRPHLRQKEIHQKTAQTGNPLSPMSNQPIIRSH